MTTETNENQELQVRQKEELQNEEGTREGIYFKPDVDIFETDQALMVIADLPGATSENIEIDLRDNLLTLTAAVEDKLDGSWRPAYAEYRTGHFMRQFRLGQNIDQAEISASVNDGVLHLTLPKAESAQPRKIEVRTGS